MKTAPFPQNEAERLFILRSLNLLDTPMEERFDRITRIVCNALGVSMATISLIDDTRQWFKSKQGIEAAETSRDIAFCSYTILQDDMLIVPDATKDDRFKDNPVVTSAPNVRFYAGVPIKIRNVLAIGTLCAIDNKPHEMTEAQKLVLQDLAKIVESEIAASLSGHILPGKEKA
jgi:GAF domain-containing protein